VGFYIYPTIMNIEKRHFWDFLTIWAPFPQFRIKYFIFWEDNSEQNLDEFSIVLGTNLWEHMLLLWGFHHHIVKTHCC